MLASGRHRAAYLIPDFHNPTAAVMSESSRGALAQAMQRAGTLAVIDESLRDVNLDGVDAAAVVRFVRRRRAAGRLRVQDVLGRPARRVDPGATRPRHAARAGADDARPGHGGVRAAGVRRGAPQPRAGPHQRHGRLPAQRDHLVDLLAEHLPELDVVRPAGGLSIWAGLPDHNSTRLVVAAREHGLLLTPGPRFFTGAPAAGEGYLRLPYTLSTTVLDDAVHRLAKAYEGRPADDAPDGPPPRSHRLSARHAGAYALAMHADADRGGVRLAELVAALSLGIDLGFDQPMEHVLRQCLIALRLAEQVGVDEQTRTAVYYTALLNNVGCHSDAHEQAKWFGDDIGLKADKYAYGTARSGSAVAGIRRLGSGADGVAQRFRVGLEFAVSGYRDVSAMITQHSEMARKLGEELGLPVAVLDALDASYEQWDGKGWPGELKGEDVPIAARLAVIGEFTEVALRVGGVEAAIKMVRGAARQAVRPPSRGCVRDPRRDPPGRARHHRHLGRRDRR